MIKVDKKMVMTGLSALFTVGSFVLNTIAKKDEVNEAAKKAAELLMDQQLKNK